VKAQGESERIAHQSQNQGEKGLYPGQSGQGVILDGFIFSAQVQRGKQGQDGKQPQPKEERAFLPCPKSGESVKGWQGRAGVTEYVIYRKIALEQKVNQG
jgi:hypothetical protein